MNGAWFALVVTWYAAAPGPQGAAAPRTAGAVRVRSLGAPTGGGAPISLALSSALRGGRAVAHLQAGVVLRGPSTPWRLAGAAGVAGAASGDGAPSSGPGLDVALQLRRAPPRPAGGSVRTFGAATVGWQGGTTQAPGPRARCRGTGRHPALALFLGLGRGSADGADWTLGAGWRRAGTNGHRRGAGVGEVAWHWRAGAATAGLRPRGAVLVLAGPVAVSRLRLLGHAAAGTRLGLHGGLDAGVGPRARHAPLGARAGAAVRLGVHVVRAEARLRRRQPRLGARLGWAAADPTWGRLDAELAWDRAHADAPRGRVRRDRAGPRVRGGPPPGLPASVRLRWSFGAGAWCPAERLRTSIGGARPGTGDVEEEATARSGFAAESLEGAVAEVGAHDTRGPGGIEGAMVGFDDVAAEESPWVGLDATVTGDDRRDGGFTGPFAPCAPSAVVGPSARGGAWPSAGQVVLVLRRPRGGARTLRLEVAAAVGLARRWTVRLAGAGGGGGPGRARVQVALGWRGGTLALEAGAERTAAAVARPRRPAPPPRTVPVAQLAVTVWPSAW